MNRSFAPARGFTFLEVIVIVAIVGLISATALPALRTGLQRIRLGSDARGIANALTLARMQSASGFTQGRLYVDFTTNSYHIEVWQKSGAAWVAQGGTRYLSAATESYGFGAVTSAPPNTQATIGEAPQCQTAGGQPIANTACIVFNSRGIPIDGTGAPTGVDALYVTDNSRVFGVTVSASSMIRLWQTNAASGATWTQQ